MILPMMERHRDRQRQKVREAQHRVTTAERQLEKAIAARDKVMIAAHGNKKDGGLSYAELANETGLSKGRVIQIIQPTRNGAKTA
jgi:hypothetical protein